MLISTRLMHLLGRLSLGSRRRAPGVREGGHRSNRRGRSQEFADHRPYVPGDDLRFLDWHLLGRLDSLWVKLFEEETDRVITLFIDSSNSMSGEKLEYARQLAAAIGYVGLNSTDRVAVAELNDGVKRYTPPRRGRSSAAKVFQTLESIHPGGATDLGHAAQALPRARGTSIGLLFSDGYDPNGLEPALKQLSRRVDELHFFHLLTPDEVEPTLRGDLTLIDRETAEELDISVSPQMLRHYREAVVRWFSETERITRKLGVHYTRISTDLDLEHLLMRQLRRQGLLR